MSVKRITITLLVLMIVVLGFASSANASSLDECNNCHLFDAQNTAEPTFFDLPVVADGSSEGSVVDKAACTSCHLATLAASHYPRLPVSVVTVGGIVYGSFASQESLYLAPDIIHYNHNNISTKTTGDTCNRCHGVVSCQSCHKTVAHTNHYSGTMLNPLTSQPVTTPILKVVTGKFNTSTGVSTPYWDMATTCATSECHQTLATPPKRTNTDGSQLCKNCHNADLNGHDPAMLESAHTTTFNQTLIPASNGENINCSNCHTNGLRNEHSNNSTGCTACHGKTTPLEVKAVIDAANGSEANRACEKCHFNMAILPLRAPNHLLDHVAKQSGGVSVVGGPHTSCNTCHEKTEVKETIRTLAYSNPKDYSCLNCHSGTPNPKAPGHVATFNGVDTELTSLHAGGCGTCHTPGTDQATKVSDIVKNYGNSGYSCTECHTNSAGHQAVFNGSAMESTQFHKACGTCHGNPEVSAIIKTLKGTTKYDCGVCHSTNRTAANPPYMPIHSVDGGGIVGYHPDSCTTCHGVKSDGSYKVDLTSIKSAVLAGGYECTNCHNGTIAKVALHKAADEKGTQYTTTGLHPTCATCHDSTDTNVRAVIDAKRGTTSPYLCADCHTGGLLAKHNADWNGSTAYETTQFHQNCAQCHANSNQAVLSKISAISSDLKTQKITSYGCTACHNNTLAPTAIHSAKLDTGSTAAYETTMFHTKLSTTETPYCFQCHGNEAVAGDMTTISNNVKSGGYLCTDCHNNGSSAPYTPNHSAVLGAETLNTVNEHPQCTTCHTVAEEKITPLKGRTDYSCEDCHTNLTQKHQSVTNLADTQFVNCSWCHSSAEPAYATNNLIGIHVKPNIKLTKEYTCNVCHGAASPVKALVAAKKTACGDCHNGTAAPVKHPDSQYLPRHVVNPFPTFLDDYKPNCSTCHAEKSLINIHAPINVGCSTCHETEVYKPVIVSLNTNCIGCHASNFNAAMDMEETHKTYHNANVEKYPDTAGCIGCHKKDDTTDGQSLLGVHRKAADSTVTCDTCHGATARQAVKDAIAANNISCQACHAGGSHNHAVLADGYAPQANVDCSTCHKTNSGDNGAELAAVHQQAADKGLISNYSCKTCHNTTFEGADKVIVKDGNLDMKKNGTTVIYCTDCHNGAFTLPDGTKVDALGTKYPAHDGKHINSIDYGTYKGTYNGTAFDDTKVTCTKCHSSLETNVVHDTKTHPNVTCNSCHASANPAVQNVINKNTSRNLVKAPYTCADCHNTLPYLHKPEHISTSQDYNTLYCVDCHKERKNPDGSIRYFWYNGRSWVDALHSDCNMCHNSDNPVVNGVIQSKMGKANSTYQPYYCEACHTTGGAQAKETAHQPEHQAKQSNTSWVCSSCHKFTASPGQAMDISPTDVHKNNCNNCHGQNARSDVKKLITSKVGQANTVYNCEDCHAVHTFEAQPMSRTIQCMGCHGTANHASADGVSRPQVYVQGAGYFYSANSPGSSPTTLHSVHSGSNKYATSVGCTGCHQTASCTACHTNVTHGQHSMTGISGIPKYTAPTFPQVFVTYNADYTITTSLQTTTSSCAVSECHGTMPKVVRKTASGDPLCVNCHSNHNVAATQFDPNTQVNCSGCHATKADGSAELDGIHRQAAADGKITDYSCYTCHDAKFNGSVIGDGLFDMKKNNQSIYCIDCHDGTKAHKADHKPDHKSVSADTVTCSGCHNGTTVKGTFNAPSTSTPVDISSAAIHGSCDKCHATQNETVKAFIASRKGTVDQPYNCEACHNSITPKHDKMHTVTAFTADGATGCANCHKLDVTEQHSASFKANLNCDTCHGADAASVLPKTPVVIGKNLSTISGRAGYTCEDCHGKVSHQHTVGKDGYQPNPKVECSACHATEATSGQAELVTVHEKASIPGFGCATCHNSTFEGSGKPISGDKSLDMLRNGQPVYCTDCHNGTLTHALGTKYPAHDGTHINSTGYGTYKGTYNGRAFDDSAADCSKCHSSLETKVVHDTTVHANVNCNSCHMSTNPQVQAVIKNAWSRAGSSAAYTCADCHNTLPYKHQPEHVATSSGSSTLNCSSCHNAASWSANGAQLAGVHENNCNTCHASSNSTVAQVIAGKQGKVNAAYNCEECHAAGGAATKESKHNPMHKASTIATNMECTGCHSFSAPSSAQPADITTLHKNGCNTCHSGATGTAAQQKAKDFIALNLGTSQAYTCEACHGTIHQGWEAKHKPTFPTNPTMVCSSCHTNYLPDQHQPTASTGSSTVGYKVFRGSSTTGPWTEVGSTTAASFADTGLLANTTYYYRIQAYDGKPNYSGYSSVISAKTLANTPVATTVNPDEAKYASTGNGDTSADPYSTTDVLARLTDNSDTTYSSVREYGTSDQYVIIKGLSDSKDYTKVELKVRVQYRGTTNLAIYPYNSNGTSINTNTSYIVDGPSRSSSSTWYTETIDVTKAAQSMQGFGWMKFRLKPDASRSATMYIANVQVVLTKAGTSGGTAVNPPGTLTSTPNDIVAPPTPTGLAGVANYYDRIDLSWDAVTDSAGGSSGNGSCAVCHSASTPQNAKDAVAAKNANCSACHAIHADITTVHTGAALATTPWNCTGCHSNVLSVEHSSSAKLKQNATLNCNTCHDSTLAKVKAAIASGVTDKSNLKCEACHTGTADGVPKMHSDIKSPHITGIFPTATDADCLKCHTTQAGEFASTMGSFHTIDGLTAKTSGRGTYLSPYTATSTVHCIGCHGDNKDGKAQTANILKRPYTYTSNARSADMLCFMCHSQSAYGGGSSRSNNGSSGFNHNISDHSPMQCSWCHAAVPHGTTKAHLIVIKGSANSTGNVLTSYTHPTSGSYSESSCGSNTSQCDEHK